MSKAFIITSFIENEIDINSRVNSEDYVICTDGGYDIATVQGIRPDLILGDFDSISGALPGDIEIKRFKPEKDFTDLELAIKTAVESEFTELEIIGGMGGRLDHTVANLQLLFHYDMYFEKLVMLDGMNECFILDSKKDSNFIIPFVANSYFSVFSLTTKTTGLCIKDAKYELTNHILTSDFPLGVSNEFSDNKNAAISMDDGTLLIVISKK